MQYVTEVNATREDFTLDLMQSVTYVNHMSRVPLSMNVVIFNCFLSNVSPIVY